MANTHDYTLANQSGSAFRTDLNTLLQEVEASNAGATAPSELSTGKLWYDTANALLKQYDGSAWVVVHSGATPDIGTPSAGVVTNLSGVLPVGVTGGSGLTLGGPVGMIAPFAMASPPTGWLACDGTVYNSSALTQYASLYTAIGNTWGGSDGTDFQVPDLEGAFLRGTGSNATHNMSDGNDFAGPSVGSFENDMFQDHTHDSPRQSALAYGMSGPTANGLYVDGNAGIVGAVATTSPYLSAYSLDAPRLGDEIRPFNAGVKYCIKY